MVNKKNKFLTGSTPEIPENQTTKNHKIIPYGAFWMVLIVIIIVVSSLIIYGTIKQNRENKNEVTNTALSNTNVEAENKIPLPPEPNEIFSYSGSITKIEDNVIYINSQVRKGDSYQEKTIKVTLNLITGDSHYTEIFRQDVSKISIPLPPGEESDNPPYEPEQISLSDLKVGDYITASAVENIKDKTEFTAEEVVMIFNSQEED